MKQLTIRIKNLTVINEFNEKIYLLKLNLSYERQLDSQILAK